MSTFISFANQVRQIAITHNHRQVIRLQGEINWCYQQVVQLIEYTQLDYFWCGDAPESIHANSYKQILGQETSLLVINAYSHFDANAFAASEGTLQGGGLLILIRPESATTSDLFSQFINQRLSEQDFIIFDKNTSLDDLPDIRFLSSEPIALNLTEQQTAVNAIVKTVTGHRRRPLVLTANRGRGKSAALGIACAELLKKGSQKILISAPNKKATDTLFKHARLSLSDTSIPDYNLHIDNQSISFIAPDLLIQTLPKCDLLIIDEAAALPVPTLEILANHYSRLVFATTQHGYEGSGRGFALRFQKRLTEISPQSRHLHLQTPIRWANNDPLESFTLNSLCLNSEDFTEPVYNSKDDVEFTVLTKKSLLKDPSLLTDVFTLLVLAHYQTKPSDLENLLNDPDLHIFTLNQKGQLLGVALVNREGNLTPQMSEQVWLGNRRLQGNLIAQSLTFHSACKYAATLHYARIQRIAIHPQIQNKGLGKALVKHLFKWAEANHFDSLCTSYGATPDLQNFWQKLSFTTLRIGLTKDTSSGTYSFIVNHPLSKAAITLQREILEKFHQQLPILLSRHLQQLNPLLIVSLLKTNQHHTTVTADLESYVKGNLPYEFVEHLLIPFILDNDLKDLGKLAQCLTIQKILQNNSWSEICQKNQLTGKKQAQSMVKNAIKQLLKEDNNAPR